MLLNNRTRDKRKSQFLAGMTAPTFGDRDGEKVGAALSTDRERPRSYRTPSKTNLDIS
jgi:hypothetical protein